MTMTLWLAARATTWATTSPKFKPLGAAARDAGCGLGHTKKVLRGVPVPMMHSFIDRPNLMWLAWREHQTMRSNTLDRRSCGGNSKLAQGNLTRYRW
jgi:hypothetical protein